MSKNKLFTALLLAGCVTLTACRTAGTQTAEIPQKLSAPQNANYETVQVVYSEYIKNGQGDAKISYPVYAQLSPEEDVRFAACYVAQGDAVKAGDVLVSFVSDTDELVLEEYSLKLARAQEELSEGTANRQTAIKKAEEKLAEQEGWDEEEEVYKPKSGLRERNIMRLNIEKQKIDMEQFIYQSEQTIRELEKQVAEIRKKVDGLKLTAPYDGVIDTVKIYREGETVHAKEVVVTMYSEEKLLLKVTEGIDDLRCFGEVTLETEVDDEKKTYTGQVISAPNILPYDAQQDFALIEITEEVTKEGLDDKVRYFYDKEVLENLLVTDKRVIRKDDQGDYVYVLEDGQVKKRYVVTGFSNSSQVWILDGLSDGQSLVLD